MYTFSLVLSVFCFAPTPHPPRPPSSPSILLPTISFSYPGRFALHCQIAKSYMLACDHRACERVLPRGTFIERGQRDDRDRRRGIRVLGEPCRRLFPCIGLSWSAQARVVSGLGEISVPRLNKTLLENNLNRFLCFLAWSSVNQSYPLIDPTAAL